VISLANVLRFIFIVPRNDKTLIVGGFAEVREGEDADKLDLTPESHHILEMCKRAKEFLPGLQTDVTHQDPAYPFAQGNRPARHNGARVQREHRLPIRDSKGYKSDDKHSRIVHSYGHAGSGWSFAFGCALDVVVLVEQVIRQEPLRSTDTDTEASTVSSGAGQCSGGP
jgi:D-amino-acid oxidase